MLLFLLIFTPLFAQDGITVIDERTDQPMLLGIHDRTALMDSNFVNWYSEEYDYYKLDYNSLEQIKEKNLEGLKTTIVMGTWCSDSRREVPHFYKIVDSLGYDESNIKMICVDHAKVGLASEVDGLNIKLVPTFIFYRDDEEIGRIIETPEETLEADLAKILK